MAAVFAESEYTHPEDDVAYLIPYYHMVVDEHREAHDNPVDFYSRYGVAQFSLCCSVCLTCPWSQSRSDLTVLKGSNCSSGKWSHPRRVSFLSLAGAVSCHASVRGDRTVAISRVPQVAPSKHWSLKMRVPRSVPLRLGSSFLNIFP